MENNNNTTTNLQDELNLREQLETYIRQWPWFVITVLIALTGAYLYLRYATPIYQTKTSIIIKDSRGLGAASEYAAFQDIGLISGMNANSIENEIALLRSKRLLNAVVQQLDLEVSYFREGNIKTTEMYGDLPFKVVVLEKSETTAYYPYPLHFQQTGETTFTITDPELNTTAEHSFGEEVALPFGRIVVIPQKLSNLPQDYTQGQVIQVYFRDAPRVVSTFQSAIQVSPIDRNASVLELSLNYPVRQKAEDILNELVFQYNRDAIEDRNMVTMNTARFIDERLSILFEELDSVETDKVEFKEEYRLTDIGVEANLTLNSAADFQKQQLNVGVQLELLELIAEQIKSQEEIALLPTNLGVSGEGLIGLVTSYNNLVLERNYRLRSATPNNPTVRSLTNQIEEVRQNVIASLQNLKTSLQTTLRDLQAQEARLGNRLYQVPSLEKEYRGIERQQNIKEALYLFLLQKREETAISMAVTAPKAKVVDAAYSSFGPIAPKRNIIYLAALLLGLLVPFLIIYLGQLLYNKIRNRKELEKESHGLSIVGEVPKVSSKDSELIGKNDRSILAESFRILRTNIEYLFINKEVGSGAKTVFVTSTVKGEGKTFVAVNLALTLATTNKKVLAIGGDIRNPQFHRFITGAKRKKGFTDFLVNDKLDLATLIEPSGLHPNLDMLYSGSIPPNPAELLMSPKVAELFDTLRTQYDYIIVDTAPSMLVTDTFLINKYADTTLYVVRADYTEKRLLEFPVDAVKTQKLNNIALILNNIKMTNFGYYGSKYYGYGYAYGSEKNTFIDKLKAFFRL